MGSDGNPKRAAAELATLLDRDWAGFSAHDLAVLDTVSLKLTHGRRLHTNECAHLHKLWQRTGGTR